jgi:hypothetical protein
MSVFLDGILYNKYKFYIHFIQVMYMYSKSTKYIW